MQWEEEETTLADMAYFNSPPTHNQQYVPYPLQRLPQKRPKSIEFRPKVQLYKQGGLGNPPDQTIR
jgi:hypothetical protein